MVEKLKEKSSLDEALDTFVGRHIGSSDADLAEMLQVVGYDSLDALADAVLPENIRLGRDLALDPPRGERELLRELKSIASRNRQFRSFIGMGYNDCITPPVIQRNILENPGWYTQYTPYQAEIAQGRLEALLGFQTMVAELTALPLANASLLDEATAAAEAMTMCRTVNRKKGGAFFVAEDCHPQTIEVVRTRADALGIEVRVGDAGAMELSGGDLFGILLQYPATDGRIRDYAGLVEQAHEAGALVVVATDLLALTLLLPPGEFGADVAVGSSQRFGVPLGFGGPHAAFIATRDQYKRQLPGRIVGVSKDDLGRPAYRLALQTREQHIRRDKATSNICTAQVLLAIMAAMYAIYHGPDGLRRIAERVRRSALALAEGLRRCGFDLCEGPFFDTLRVSLGTEESDRIVEEAEARFINLRRYPGGDLGIALDETVTRRDLEAILASFGGEKAAAIGLDEIAMAERVAFEGALERKSDYLSNELFQRYHNEHELLRYINRLRNRDISLTHSMIPLGSCTMKLTGTSLMLPVSWPEFAAIHPFAPESQTEGYLEMMRQLEAWLCEITGFSAITFQPNAGAQGEYTGLLTIRAFHAHRGESERNICLIPTSAHGTNPASAVMAGFKVVPVACDDKGNIDLADLEAKAVEHAGNLGALMITYPSTHGVFEQEVRRACDLIHANGGQVYLDGANMNAQLGLCRPADYGADVCHLNLHKTFCIPHGGGGPGVGPVGAAAHLAPFLPGHPYLKDAGDLAIGPVAAAPYGSPSILPISWVFIGLMGARGLKKAGQVAILNANYVAKRLEEHYPVLYTGKNGLAAHEFIMDLRGLKESSGVTVDDVAKRLMDFGIHAPTMSWPVIGTMMVEPTESESREELDRFCDAMITIRREIRDIEEGRIDRENNPLKHAPHTAEALLGDDWDRPYSREQGAYPSEWVRERKFWPAVGRIDNAYGDKNLVCCCGQLETDLPDRH